jgi:hypothetical protein
MLVRVNIATEAGGETYLVNTDDIDDQNVHDAIIHAINYPRSTSKEFGNITVTYGELIQRGYEINNALDEIAMSDDVPSVPVITDI